MIKGCFNCDDNDEEWTAAKCSCTTCPAEFGPYMCFWMSRPQSLKKQKQHSYNFFPPSILASIHCTYTQIFLFFFHAQLLSSECMCEDWNRRGSSSSNILVFLKSHSEEPSRVWCTKISIVCASTFSLLCGL